MGKQWIRRLNLSPNITSWDATKRWRILWLRPESRNIPRDFTKWKSFCTAKEQSKDTTDRVGENICKLFIGQRDIMQNRQRVKIRKPTQPEKGQHISQRRAAEMANRYPQNTLTTMQDKTMMSDHFTPARPSPKRQSNRCRQGGRERTPGSPPVEVEVSAAIAENSTGAPHSLSLEAACCASTPTPGHASTRQWQAPVRDTVALPRLLPLHSQQAKVDTI